MCIGSIKPDRSDEIPPSPRPGFETEILAELERLFSVLPSGAATLYVGRIPGHPEWPEPYFRVIPANSRAARFEGFAVVNDLTLVIGNAEREFVDFASGGSMVRGTRWQDEFRWIWDRVIAGGFSQYHYLDSHGNVIGWSANFAVNGHELIFRNGRRRERFFRRTRVRQVTYEPY